MQYSEEGAGTGKVGAAKDPASVHGVNYYRVLDVDPSAPRMTIREAYLRLKNAYGNGSAALYSLISEDEAAEQLAQIEAAFRVLSDEVARRAYDVECGFKQPRQRQGAVNQAPGLPADYRDEPRTPNFYGTRATDPPPQMPEPMIRTHRSTLPIIKLKASRAGAEDVLGKLDEIIKSGDPADGDLLRRLREASEVSEDEICERTKVSMGFIRAIESNRFERLPQSVFVKGFLRSYLRYLCVPDAETFVTAFSARLSDWQLNRKG